MQQGPSPLEGLGGVRVGVASQHAAEEERVTAWYLAETAKMAGLTAHAIELDTLHVDEASESKHVVDSSGQQVDVLWKLYP